MAEPNRLAAALSYEQDRPAFGNPRMLEQGRKMRERKQAEQVERSAQNVKNDLLARALMRRYNPETPPGLSDTGPQTGLTDTQGPQTLDEAAGLDPRVDRSTFLPYSKKEGWHVPAVVADVMKLATASNPQYSNLMQPEEAMQMATNLMGGGMAASRLAPAPAGSLGMNVTSKRAFAAPQDEALRLAQQRAALPVKQGGLGLPADNTPQQRAAAMGAEFGWGHGSNNPNITTFKPSRTGAQGPGIYATNYLPETNMYSSLKDTGGTSYPLAVFKDEALVSKLNNPYDELKVAADDELISELFKRNKSAIITNQEPTPDWLLKQGVNEYPERQHYVSVNPDNFRSRFAAFDPFRRSAAVAAAMGAAAPDLLANPMYTDPFGNTIADTTR